MVLRGTPSHMPGLGSEQSTEKSEAVKQLSETITQLSAEKRSVGRVPSTSHCCRVEYERAEQSDFQLKQAISDLQQLEADSTARITELKA